MYELIEVGERTYYIDCPAKMGLYRAGNSEVYLIDSGNDKQAGKKALRLIEANGWRLMGILNTHAHADHTGGNRFLQDRTGCTVSAPGSEGAVAAHTFLEPALLYGGCPPKELRGKFLLAQESLHVRELSNNLPEGLALLSLRGHYLDMAGIKTPDGVWFLADALFPKSTIEKYHVFYLYDVGGFLCTLDRLETLEGRLFIPSHAEVTDDLSALIALNRQKVLEICGVITKLCQTPCTFDEVLKGVFDYYGLVMDFSQYALVGSTVRSYLTYLHETGALEVCFEQNRLLWAKKEESA